MKHPEQGGSHTLRNCGSLCHSLFPPFDGETLSRGSFSLVLNQVFNIILCVDKFSLTCVISRDVTCGYLQAPFSNNGTPFVFYDTLVV